MQSGWISTDERMPEINQAVLVWLVDGVMSRPVIEIWTGKGWKGTSSRGVLRGETLLPLDTFDYWAAVPGSPWQEFRSRGG
jgi:hypothetical protein